MIKTVIFDMDGVIVDTEPVHHYAYNQHFKQLNIDVSPEMYATFTGNSTKNIFERLKVQYNLSDDVPTLVETKRNLFNEAFDSKEDLYLLDGVEDLIKDLYQNGMQLVLASSSATVTISIVLGCTNTLLTLFLEKIFQNPNHIQLFFNMPHFWQKLL